MQVIGSFWNFKDVGIADENIKCFTMILNGDLGLKAMLGSMVRL